MADSGAHNPEDGSSILPPATKNIYRGDRATAAHGSHKPEGVADSTSAPATLNFFFDKVVV